jgi:hypothetical protein
VQAIEVTMPGGMVVGDCWYRTARLRSLSGYDEAFLMEEASALTPAARPTALLARCLEQLGPTAPIDARAIQSLAIGDREALLLHLRRLTFGENIAGVLSCPHPECSAKMDLPLTVSELLMPPYSYETLLHEAMVEDQVTQYRVSFRLPNGSDQEAAAPLAVTDTAAAADLVLERCVQEIIELESGRALGWLPQAVKETLPSKMVDLDPQAEILLNLTCSKCARAFVLPFDTGAYLYQEIARQAQSLYREVHLLAFHYHWSEAEILGMTARRRHRYLELLCDDLGEGRRM